MGPKWTTKLEAKALVALLYVLHNGAPKLDQKTCKQLEAEMCKEGFSAEAIRQRVQGLMRKFAIEKGYQTTGPSTSAASAKTLTAAGSKLKGAAIKAFAPAKKRADNATVNDGDDDDEMVDLTKVKDEGSESSVWESDDDEA